MSGPDVPSTTDTRRHSHSLRPRRVVNTASPATDMATIPTAGPSTSTSSTGASQYVTRSATGSLSPVKREAEDSTSPEGEEAGEDEEGGDPEARAKLELKREKNRVKQRNLRLRRNIQMKDLEDQVQQANRDTALSQTQISNLTANEAKYTSWIQELEAVLIQQGLGTEVESLRRKWSKEIVPLYGKLRSAGRKGKSKVSTLTSSSNPRPGADPSLAGLYVVKPEDPDPLATLVHAAMSTENSLMPPGAYRHQTLVDNTSLYQGPPPLASQPQRLSHSQPTYRSAVPEPTMPRSQSQSQMLFSGPHRSQPVHPASQHHHHHRQSHDDRRRPSTSYTQPSPIWPPSDFAHPALKRKRSVSGPIQHATPATLPPLHSVSEPSSAHRPFESLPGMNTTLPPIISLPGVPDPVVGAASSSSSSTRTARISPSSSSITLAPIRPMTAPSTPPLASRDMIPPSALYTPPRGMGIANLLSQREKGRAEERPAFEDEKADD